MKTFTSLIVALVLPISLSIVEASLEEACKKVDQNPRGVDYNFCMTSLQVVPESRNADAQGLAIIAANLAIANVTHNREKIKELLNNKNMSELSKKELQGCVYFYDNSVNDFKEAIAAIKSNDRGTASAHFCAAMHNVDTCVFTSNESKEEFMMSKEVYDAEETSMLALDIADSFLNCTLFGYDCTLC